MATYIKTLKDEDNNQIVPRTTAGAVQANGTTLDSVLTGLAPKASPALTGTPTAPTADASTNNTQIATTAYVTRAITTSAYSISGTTLQLKLADGYDASTHTIVLG